MEGTDKGAMIRWEKAQEFYEKFGPLFFAANALPAGMSGMVGAVNVALFEDEGAGNSEGQEITLADNWFQVSPFGVFPNEKGLQVFDASAANEIVALFNSFREQVGQRFRGLPIYLGHPDFQPNVYPDKRRYGSIQQLEVRDAGLYAKPKWNKLGREAVNEEHYVFQSPYWGMRQVTHEGQPAFRPALLESVGLTNNPNIPGLPVGANEKPAADPNLLDPMTKEALIKKFNLQPAEGQTEVTDAQIDAAVDAALANLNQSAASRALLAEKLGVKPKDGQSVITDDDFDGAITGLRGQVTTATDVRDNTLVEAAVNEARITAAEKPSWLTRLKTDFAGASAALKGLVPAVNTRPEAAHTANLGRRDKGADGAASAGEQFTKAVNERMATTKEDWSTAWTACQKTHQSLYAQMQQPKGL